MNSKFKAIATFGAAVVLTCASAFAAQAGELASGTVKAPYSSGNSIVGEANLNGPVPVGTVFCVRILAQHPMGPDVEVATKCQRSNGGTLKVKTSKTCGNYSTWADATYNGRHTFVRQSQYAVLGC